MKWTDINELAIELAEKYPEIDPKYLLFTDLHSWVLDLKDFEDDPNRSNEQLLEAIHMAWIDELD